MCNDSFTYLYHVLLDCPAIILVLQDTLLGTLLLKVWFFPESVLHSQVFFSCWLIELHIIGILIGLADFWKEARFVILRISVDWRLHFFTLYICRQWKQRRMETEARTLRDTWRSVFFQRIIFCALHYFVGWELEGPMSKLLLLR